jgi:hypothetical protein
MRTSLTISSGAFLDGRKAGVQAQACIDRYRFCIDQRRSLLKLADAAKPLSRQAAHDTQA